MCGMQWGVAEHGSFQQDPSRDDGDEDYPCEMMPVVASWGVKQCRAAVGRAPPGLGLGRASPDFPVSSKSPVSEGINSLEPLGTGRGWPWGLASGFGGAGVRQRRLSAADAAFPGRR